MKNISILMISNSFGVNIEHYVHQISTKLDTQIHIGVLYIGGCSLETHYNNTVNDAKAYDYYENGQLVRNEVSIKEALLYEDWDYVSLQQVSGLAGIYESYFPFIEDVKKYVEGIRPNVKFVMHATWNYEFGSSHPHFPLYCNDPYVMYQCVRETYYRVAQELGIDIIVPSGEIVWAMTKANQKVHYDGFHMNNYGEYAIGLGMVHTLLDIESIKDLYIPNELTYEQCALCEKVVAPLFKKLGQNGKKVVAFLGDSITEGVGASKEENSFVNVFKRLANVDVLNYGISGTRVAKQINKTEANPQYDESMYYRAKYMKKADFVFFFGGTNDFGHGDAPIGKIGDNTIDTFAGAYSKTLDVLIEKYGRNNVCAVLPAHRHNEDNPCGDNKINQVATLREYKNIMIQLCQMKGVNFIDLFMYSPITKEMAPSSFYVDGLHPSDSGHAAIAGALVGYFMNRR